LNAPITRVNLNLGYLGFNEIGRLTPQAKLLHNISLYSYHECLELIAQAILVKSNFSSQGKGKRLYRLAIHRMI